MQSHGRNVPRISAIVGMTSPFSGKPRFVASFEILSLYPRLSLWLSALSPVLVGINRNVVRPHFFYAKPKLNLWTQTESFANRRRDLLERRSLLTHTIDTQRCIHAYSGGQKAICVMKCSLLYMKLDSCFEIYRSEIFFALDKRNRSALKITIHHSRHSHSACSSAYP